MLKKTLVLSVLAVAALSRAASAQVPLPDPIGYKLELTYKAPDGAMRDTVLDAVVLVPSVVDVDGDTLPDVIAQLQIDAGRATLRVDRLPFAPSPLPLKTSATLADPRGASTLRVTFGVDALADDSPTVFDAAVTLIGASRVTSINLDMTTAQPGSTIGLFGEVFDAGTGNQHLDPQSGRADFTPVPATTHFAILNGGDLGVDQLNVQLAADIETTVAISFEDVRGAHNTVVGGRIDKLPRTVSLERTSIAATQETYSYSAGGRAGLVELLQREYEGGELQSESIIRLTDMAESATLIRDTADRFRFSAPTSIGGVEIGLGGPGGVRWLDEPAYVYAEGGSVAVRVLGLRAAEVDTGEGRLYVATQMQPGPFHALIVDGQTSFDALVRDLPGDVTLDVQPAAGSATYQGSARIGEFNLHVSDPTGVIGRATSMDLLIRDIPTSLSLGFAPITGTASFDANGQTVGLVELSAHSGTPLTLPADRDGIVLRDTAAQYAIFGRLTGLRRVVLQQEPVDLTLETTGGRVFVADADTNGEYVRATLDRLQSSIRVAQTASGISYTASAPTNSLTLDTNSGDRWNLHASVGYPLPASFSLCQHSGNGCVTSTPPRSAGSGSVRFTASEHTTVNLFDCVEPRSASCPGSPTKYTRVDNLRVRHLEVDAEASSSGATGYIFVNTTSGVRHPLSGRVTTDFGNGIGIDMNLATGFSANNRLSRWTNYGLPFIGSVAKTGEVTCPSGTYLDVIILGLRIGVTGYLC